MQGADVEFGVACMMTARGEKLPEVYPGVFSISDSADSISSHQSALSACLQNALHSLSQAS